MKITETYNHGVSTYGQKGAIGITGSSGNSVHFSSLSGEDASIIINRLISEEKALSNNDQYQRSESFQAGDIIFDMDGGIYVISDNDTISERIDVLYNDTVEEYPDSSAKISSITLDASTVDTSDHTGVMGNGNYNHLYLKEYTIDKIYSSYVTFRLDNIPSNEVKSIRAFVTGLDGIRYGEAILSPEEGDYSIRIPANKFLANISVNTDDDKLFGDSVIVDELNNNLVNSNYNFRLVVEYALDDGTICRVTKPMKDASTNEQSEQNS